MIFYDCALYININLHSNNIRKQIFSRKFIWKVKIFHSVSLWNWFWRIISQMKFTDSIIDWIFINIPFVLRSGWLYGRVADHCWPVRYLPNVQQRWQIYKPHKQKLGEIKYFIFSSVHIQYLDIQVARTMKMGRK